MNKLVRDNIPQIIIDSGRKPITRILTDEEYKKELVNKLIEEVNEFRENPCKEELADIIEVVDALSVAHEIGYTDIAIAKFAKLRSNGAFNDKIFLERIEDDQN